MLGVTIGIGDYAEQAAKSANDASKFLDLSDVLVLNEEHLKIAYGSCEYPENIYRLKFFIFQITKANQYVYFDVAL